MTLAAHPEPPCPQCAHASRGVDAETAWCERCGLLWRLDGAAGAQHADDVAPIASGFAAGREVGGVRRRLGVRLPRPKGPASTLGYVLGRLVGEGGSRARQLGHVQAPAGARVLVVGQHPLPRALKLAGAGWKPTTLGPGETGAPRIPHHEGAPEQMHRAVGAFEVVLLDRTLAVADDPRRVLEGARERLAPGGHVVVLEMPVGGRVQEAAAALAERGELRAWAVAGLRGLIRASHLVVLTTRRLPTGEALFRARAAP
ncbi:MAG: hypothetical protein AB7T63_03115 [Planctomycetota bacterium]